MDMFNLTKLKSALKRQLSLPIIQNHPRRQRLNNNNNNNNNNDDSPEESNKILSTTSEQAIVVARSDKTRCSSSRRRRKSSSSRPNLGVLEEIILCPLCKCKLRSPRTLACQHSFCKKCLDLELSSSPKAPPSCPSCRTPLADFVSTELLPVNAGVAKLLEAVDREDFVEQRRLDDDDHDDDDDGRRRGERRHSLVVNFRQLMTTRQPQPQQQQQRQSTTMTRPATMQRSRERKISAQSSIAIRCCNCRAAYCDAQDACRHCNQIYCRTCREIHVQRLAGAIIDRLTIAADNLDKRARDFRIGTEKCREAVLEDFDKKLAELERDKARRLRLIDESRERSELALERIRGQVESSRRQLMNRCDNRDDDGAEKVDGLLELYRRSLETARLAEAWQVPRLIEDDDEIVTMAALGDGNERQNLLSERANAQRPGGMARDPRTGEIFIACPGNGQIVVLDRRYRLLRRIRNPDLVISPQSLAVHEHEIYVSDKCQHSILVLDRRGQLLRRLGTGRGSSPGQLRCPRGIALSSSSSSGGDPLLLLYVADTGNDRVQIYDGRDGSLVQHRQTSFDFDRPSDVAVSRDTGHVCVADSGNHKIHVFEPRLAKLLFSCGAHGALDGLFRSPTCVEFGGGDDDDDDDEIYVGDRDNGRIQVFSAQGQFVRVVRQTSRGFGRISGLIRLPGRGLLVADGRDNALYSLRSSY